MMSTQMAVSASAADIGFSDVSPDSPWYEGVEYAAEHGLTNGTGNNCYSPDAPITARQWAVMTCRAREANIEQRGVDDFGMACLKYAFQHGWLDYAAVIEPDISMCRGALYQSAFQTFEVPVYDSILYPGGPAFTAWENTLRVGRELGLYSADGSVSEIVTRGETANLLFGLITKPLAPQEPPMLAVVNIQNNDGLALNDCLLELRRMPETIMEAFCEEGCVYTINCDYLAQLSERLDMSCIGTANYGQKRIYVSKAGGTIHELGHFLDKKLGFPEEHERLYQLEGEAAAKLIRDYVNTNSHEFLAGCVTYWIDHPDSPEKMVFSRPLYLRLTFISNNWNCKTGARKICTPAKKADADDTICLCCPIKLLGYPRFPQ